VLEIALERQPQPLPESVEAAPPPAAPEKQDAAAIKH
jgi:hypothetical protein